MGQFLIKHGDQTVLDVAADQENLGHMKIIMDGKEVDPMPGEMTYTSESHKRVKFVEEVDRVKWAHLNVNLNNGLPAGSQGIFAELVGIQPLSNATKELLERPQWASDYATHRRASKGPSEAKP